MRAVSAVTAVHRLRIAGHIRARPACCAHPAATRMASSETLSSLLFRGRDAALSGDSSSALTLVLGNEAADLDSVVCAVGLAALLQSQGCAAAAVVGVPRADLRLRPELGWLLQRLALDEKMLLCADELDVRAAAAQQTLRVALVDHNRLARAHEEVLAGAVAEIVDHHDDDRQYPAAHRNIAPLGSCSTLVTERILAALPALLNDSALCTLLLSAILLDTGNLTGASGRMTERDTRAAEMLSSRLQLSVPARNALFESLLAKRSDQGRLCTSDLLRRDYKEWDMHGWRVGVSAISLPLAQLVERGDADPLPAALEGWASERRLDFLLLMTTHGQGEAFRRQLAVSAFGQQALNLLPSLTKALGESELRLQTLDLPQPGWPLPGQAYDQQHLKGSRKVVQPVLAQIFDRLDGTK